MTHSTKTGMAVTMLLLAVLLACKRGGDSGGAGAACSSDSDCKNGFLCESGACMAKAAAEKIRGTTGSATGESAGSAEHEVGDKLDVEWKGSWYPATVLEVVGGGKVKIHYDGYGSEWDEVVGPDRIRKQGSAPAAAAGGGDTPSAGPGAGGPAPVKTAPAAAGDPAPAGEQKPKSGPCKRSADCGKGKFCCQFAGAPQAVCADGCPGSLACVAKSDCPKGNACIDGSCSADDSEEAASPGGGKAEGQTCASSAECKSGLSCCDLTGIGGFDGPVCKPSCGDATKL